ncbi:Low molecular weight protein tyrosine phosphatase [invertebrate metagenome]|uniref:protein-tyrosine-phosphatase n=1 Tax=invertebrate metagenome TaxID=1711999 RepID=A0A484H4S0_9ZZZZ
MNDGAGPFQVLFVCTGNICRSPTAEGLFLASVARAGLSERVTADSAGISGWHVGASPDERAIAAARRRGVDISALRARQVAQTDFASFHLILTMEGEHLLALARLCPPAMVHRLHLLLSFAPETGSLYVPDPYYGGQEGFTQVLDLLEAGTTGLLTYICGRLAENDGITHASCIRHTSQD